MPCIKHFLNYSCTVINMINHVFKKSRKKTPERAKYYSAPFLELYLPKRNNLIKNYVITPDSKLVDAVFDVSNSSTPKI